jgi:protocatechuate 3,4-dioxygenase beta subunit
MDLVLRLCLFGMLLSASLSAQPAQDSAANAAPRTARLEGQVLSQTGEPLRKATLWLKPYYGDHSSNPVSYTDTTDGAGKFVFEGVLPGRYTLSAERTGFLPQDYGARGAATGSPGSVLTLTAGEIMKDLNFKLIPQGVITGRVTDADGDPMPGVQVSVTQTYHARGQRGLVPKGRATTDDQGSFRIANLSPGPYYVSADDAQSRVREQNNGVRPGRVLNRASNVTTYYPDSIDAASATALQIVAGSELRGIDIRMRQERVFSIRGLTIDAATGKPATTALNARLKSASPYGFNSSWDTSSREDGTFELRNLLPGEYVLMASSTNNNSEPAYGREEISISDSDITGVKVTLEHGVTVAGTVKLEGGGPLGRLSISVIGFEDGAFRPAFNAQPKDDGTFELHGVTRAKYDAHVEELPEGVYVKSIRFGQQDITRTVLDLTSDGSGTLDILLSPHAAEVSGTVKNKDGAAMTGVEVTLWPKQGLSKSVYRGSTDQNGDFRIAGLAPGDYYMNAWEDLDPYLSFDLEFLKRFASLETTMTLEESAHETVQPKLISREDAAAEAAKLP